MPSALPARGTGSALELRPQSYARLRQGSERSKNPAHAPNVSRTFHALGREPLARGSATATGGPGRCSDTCARRLWAGAPAAKPGILVISPGIREALIPILHGRPIEDISLGCSRQRCKHRQSRHSHRELTHFYLPQFLVAQTRHVGRPAVALILHQNNIAKKINGNKKINIYFFLIIKIS
jgi:hypothetical protein